MNRKGEKTLTFRNIENVNRFVLESRELFVIVINTLDTSKKFKIFSMHPHSLLIISVAVISTTSVTANTMKKALHNCQPSTLMYLPPK